MADWLGNRRNVKWTYRRVSWDTWEEIGEYGNIVGGSDDESYFTALKGGGSLKYVGEAPSTTDLIRTYYEFDDDEGEHVRQEVSTMLVESTSDAIEGSGAVTGTVSLYSVLKVADDRLPGLPLTVSANTNAVEMAQTLLHGLGLRTQGEVGGYTLANDHTFKPDDSYLTIINWLLTSAGYASASPNSKGEVVLARYENATERTPVFTFRDDRRSIMYPKVEDENDYSETPNVVRLFAEDEYGGYWAVAKNVDKESRPSLYNRGGEKNLDDGRERTLYDEVTELKPEYDPDDTPEDAAVKASQRAEALLGMARQKLLDNSAEIEYVTISNGYYPLTQGDSVEIVYKDRRWRGTVTNISRDHTTESKCQTKIRRYVAPQLEMLEQSGVIGFD